MEWRVLWGGDGLGGNTRQKSKTEVLVSKQTVGNENDVMWQKKGGNKNLQGGGRKNTG